jgi:hypothetical protein
MDAFRFAHALERHRRLERYANSGPRANANTSSCANAGGVLYRLVRNAGLCHGWHERNV